MRRGFLIRTYDLSLQDTTGMGQATLLHFLTEAGERAKLAIDSWQTYVSSLAWAKTSEPLLGKQLKGLARGHAANFIHLS